jgi:parvulin-like peptidyl-prolyl isomerase
MNKYKFLYILVIIPILFHSVNVFSQTFGSEQKLVKVGNRIISEYEFLERYELTPGINRQDKKFAESSKIDFLYTLIAEKLWAIEAVFLGLDTIEVMKFSRDAFEKLFIRDELYRREILNKIQITDEELVEGFRNNSTILKINFLFSEDEEEINKLYNLLSIGISFDSILSERPEFEEQPEPLEIVYGQMEKKIEDSLYSLRMGEYTLPILTPDGWYIFRIQNRTEQLLSRIEDIENSKNTVGKIIKARKEQEIYNEFYYNFFRNKSVDVNPVLFESLAQKLSKVLLQKKNIEKIKNGDPVFLLADEVLSVEQMFGVDSLKMNFLLFDEKPITLKYFIRTLAYEGFKALEIDIVSMRALLDYKTRKSIEQELLVREGYERNLHMTTEVQNQLQMWYDNYLFQILQNQFLDSLYISDKEVNNYYQTELKKERKPILVNIVEVLTDSLEVVQYILNEVENGKDIKELAGKYTKREWTKDRQGEFGLFEADSYGQIGIIASQMEVGEIYGPLELPEGYSIFKVIDKRKRTGPPASFEKVKMKYKNQLTFKKLRSKINNFTTHLALKYGLEINWDILASIEVTNINSFGIRYLGFGGKITAVPLLAPNSNWVESYLKKLDTIQ